MIQYENDLHTKVNLFKEWTKKNYPKVTEQSDNGEWCFGDEFEEMCSAAISYIECVKTFEATKAAIDDILYCIARDNECSHIVDILEEYDDWFSLLCRECLNTDYVNAKWQFAEHLPNYHGSDDLCKIVYKFLVVDDEYTERMALKALAYIDPECAEHYAVEFWERDKYKGVPYSEEYQKIMVLSVLDQIHSPKLPYYLSLAKKSKYKYLKQNAEDIEEKYEDRTYCNVCK